MYHDTIQLNISLNEITAVHSPFSFMDIMRCAPVSTNLRTAARNESFTLHVNIPSCLLSRTPLVFNISNSFATLISKCSSYFSLIRHRNMTSLLQYKSQTRPVFLSSIGIELIRLCLYKMNVCLLIFCYKRRKTQREKEKKKDMYHNNSNTVSNGVSLVTT